MLRQFKERYIRAPILLKDAEATECPVPSVNVGSIHGGSHLGGKMWRQVFPRD